MDDVTVQTDDVVVDINDGQVTADVSDDAYYYSDDSVSVDTEYMTGDDFGAGDYYMETGVPAQDVDPAAMAAIAGFGIMAFVIWLAMIVIMIVSLWKIFTKAGQPGWASIIPIYNMIVWLQIIQKPLWWIILLFIPFVNIVIAIMMYHELSKAFGKSVGYTLGMLFLGIIFFPMLAFGSATYVKASQPVSPTAV